MSERTSHRWWYDEEGKLHVEPIDMSKPLVIPPYSGGMLVLKEQSDEKPDHPQTEGPK